MDQEPTTNNHLRIVFWGTPKFVAPVMDGLNQKNWLCGVVTAPDKKVGRNQQLTPTPIASATPTDTAILKTDNPKEIEEELKKMQPDIFIVAAYGKILPKEVLDIPRYGSLNIHPSLLPKYRGPSPIQTAILNGDKTSGITIYQMDEKMDHGPIISTKEIILLEQETLKH